MHAVWIIVAANVGKNRLVLMIHALRMKYFLKRSRSSLVAARHYPKLFYLGVVCLGIAIIILNLAGHS